MNYSRTYQGIIWTNHALERLKARQIPQELAWKAFRFPDSSQHGKSSKSKEFVKQINNQTITVIAKQNERKEWLILSGWIYPPLTGSIDAKDQYQNKESVFTWLFHTIFRVFWRK